MSAARDLGAGDVPGERVALDDPRLEPFRDLKARRRGGSVLVVESALAVERLVASGAPVDAVLATPAQATRLVAALEAWRSLADLSPTGASLLASPLASPLGGPSLGGSSLGGPSLAGPSPLHRSPVTWPLLLLEPSDLRALTGLDLHRACLATTPRPVLPAPAAALTTPAPPTSLALALVAVRDPLNVGALVRSARAFGVDVVLLSGAGADPFDPRAVRASMANVFTQPLGAGDVRTCVAAWRAARPGGRVLAATTAPDATPVGALPSAAHTLLLLGNEGEGLSAEAVALADASVTIPIDPAADSLNVAAAGAVLLYALRLTAP